MELIGTFGLGIGIALAIYVPLALLWLLFRELVRFWAGFFRGLR